MGQLLRNEPLTVIGDGKQTRCFTYIDDAIRATVAAGLKEEANGEIFNIGTDVETTIKELAEVMIKITGANSTIKYVKQEEIYGKSYEDIPRRVPDVTKMKKLLGITANISLEEGLKKTIEWFKNL
jgi:UDP-glucose 4-epimerase